MISRIGLLQVVHHEVAVSKTTPDVAIVVVDLEDSAQILYSLRERILGTQDARDTLHGWHRPLVVLERKLVALHRAVEVLHLF